MKVEVFRRMHTKAGKGSKFNSREKRGASIDVVKKEKGVFGSPDPRERNYPEDLEGLTEGERKLMKPKKRD